MYKIQGACTTNIGKVRENNEDNIYFNGKYLKENHGNLEHTMTVSFSSGDNLIFSVFDGMGGEAKGERASYLAASYLDSYIKENQDKNWNFKDYIKKANRLITKESSKHMGTTMAAITFFEDKIDICNLGDSRIYQLKNKTLIQISKDHTDLELHKKLNASLNQKPKLTEHLGIDENEMELSPHIREFDYQDGDRFIICSDGLTDMLSNQEISEILLKYKSDLDIVETLVNKALEKGGKDNVTIMSFSVKRKKNNKPKLLIGIILLILIVLFFIVILNKNKFQINDECNNLVVGDECNFKFDDNKYQIKIEGDIAIYNDGKIVSKRVGTTDIIIFDKSREVYKKTIKVFPK